MYRLRRNSVTSDDHAGARKTTHHVGLNCQQFCKIPVQIIRFYDALCKGKYNMRNDAYKIW
jgi:hypothetical protein